MAASYPTRCPVCDKTAPAGKDIVHGPRCLMWTVVKTVSEARPW
jgi:hypothetical protein